MSRADAIGWVATACFAGSYLFASPAALRLAQMGGAGLWIGYGLLSGARPVVAANALVLAAAAWAQLRSARAPAGEAAGERGGEAGV